MKTKSLYFCVLAFILCLTVATAQPGCRKYTSFIRRGQRVCQRLCFPSPQIRCYTSRFGERMSLCPADCCRVAQFGCRLYRVAVHPRQRVCQILCSPTGRVVCYTASRFEMQNICQPGCCRFGIRCHPVLNG